MPVAALYVDPKGPYVGLDGVDVWDEARDARLYNLTHPVVAHPPCGPWSRLAALMEVIHGNPRHEDDGKVASALDTVRRCGGVMEHPAFSAAWRFHGLTAPPRGGGWMPAGLDDPGWTCEVSQGAYGHVARKLTWLYAVGCELPSLPWGDGPPGLRVSALRMPRDGRTESGPDATVMKTAQRHLTPAPFRDMLLAMARSVR